MFPGDQTDNPQNAVPLGRAAGVAHWSPGSLPEGAEPGLRETVLWSMPGLDPPDEDDRVNSSGANGFVFDMCGVEVDDTGRSGSTSMSPCMTPAPA